MTRDEVIAEMQPRPKWGDALVFEHVLSDCDWRFVRTVARMRASGELVRTTVNNRSALVLCEALGGPKGGVPVFPLGLDGCGGLGHVGPGSELLSIQTRPTY